MTVGTRIFCPRIARGKLATGTVFPEPGSSMGLAILGLLADMRATVWQIAMRAWVWEIHSTKEMRMEGKEDTCAASMATLLGVLHTATSTLDMLAAIDVRLIHPRHPPTRPLPALARRSHMASPLVLRLTYEQSSWYAIHFASAPSLCFSLLTGNCGLESSNEPHAVHLLDLMST